MYTQLMKPFQMTPSSITQWPWLWPLTYISGNFNLAITIEPLEVELSYFMCTFIVMGPLRSCQKFWPSDLHPTYLKTFNFWTVRDKGLHFWHANSKWRNPFKWHQSVTLIMTFILKIANLVFLATGGIHVSQAHFIYLPRDHGIALSYMSIPLSRPSSGFTIIFSSPEPKAQVSYCHSAPSVVRPSVRPSVVGVRRPS